MARSGVGWWQCDHGVHRDSEPGRRDMHDDGCAHVHGDGPDEWYGVHLHRDGHQREWHGSCVSGVDRGHSGEAATEHAAGGAGDPRHGWNPDHADGGVRAEELHSPGDLCDLAGAAGRPVDGFEHGRGVGDGHGRLPEDPALDLGDHYGQRGDDVVGAGGDDRGPVTVSEPLSDGIAVAESDDVTVSFSVADGIAFAIAEPDELTESDGIAFSDELTESDGFAQSVSDGFTLAVTFSDGFTEPIAEPDRLAVAVSFPGADSDA